MRRLDFVSFQVTDLEKSTRFYTEKLGFTLSPMHSPDTVIFQFNKDREAGFAIRKPLGDLGEKPLGVGVSAWFAIDENIELLHAKWMASGVPILGEIIETPFGRAFHVSDPDGYKLTFIAPNA